jgi:hypothetical protein
VSVLLHCMLGVFVGEGFVHFMLGEFLVEDFGALYVRTLYRCGFWFTVR